VFWMVSMMRSARAHACEQAVQRIEILAEEPSLRVLRVSEMPGIVCKYGPRLAHTNSVPRNKQPHDPNEASQGCPADTQFLHLVLQRSALESQTLRSSTLTGDSS